MSFLEKNNLIFTLTFFLRSFVPESELNADELIHEYEQQKKLENPAFLTRKEWSEEMPGRKCYPLIPRNFIPGAGLHIYGDYDFMPDKLLFFSN